MKNRRRIRRLEKQVEMLRRHMRRAYHALSQLDERTKPAAELIGYRHEESEEE